MHKVAEINLYIPIIIINVNKLTLSVKRIRVEFLKKNTSTAYKIYLKYDPKNEAKRMEKAFQKNANPKKAGIAIIYLTK